MQFVGQIAQSEAMLLQRGAMLRIDTIPSQMWMRRVWQRCTERSIYLPASVEGKVIRSWVKADMRRFRNNVSQHAYTAVTEKTVPTREKLKNFLLACLLLEDANDWQEEPMSRLSNLSVQTNPNSYGTFILELGKGFDTQYRESIANALEDGYKFRVKLRDRGRLTIKCEAQPESMEDLAVNKELESFQLPLRGECEQQGLNIADTTRGRTLTLRGSPEDIQQANRLLRTLQPDSSVRALLQIGQFAQRIAPEPLLENTQEWSCTIL